MRHTRAFCFALWLCSLLLNGGKRAKRGFVILADKRGFRAANNLPARAGSDRLTKSTLLLHIRFRLSL
jgi:hypothetical protein